MTYFSFFFFFFIRCMGQEYLFSAGCLALPYGQYLGSNPGCHPLDHLSIKKENEY